MEIFTKKMSLKQLLPTSQSLLQLQIEANIHPTEIPLHSFFSGENPHFVQTQAQWWYTKLVFPLNRTKKLWK